MRFCETNGSFTIRALSGIRFAIYGAWVPAIHCGTQERRHHKSQVIGKFTTESR